MTHDEYKEELAKVEAKLADPKTPQDEIESLKRAYIHLAQRVAHPQA